MNKDKEPISIRYIDKDIYDKLINIAKVKGCNSTKKVDIFNFILEDYINMHELDEFKNPYLIKAVQEIISSSVSSAEKNLGGRLFKIVGECSLNISILNQIIFNYMNKFGDDEESNRLLKQYREIAVESLRENKFYPMSYTKLIKDDNEI